MKVKIGKYPKNSSKDRKISVEIDDYDVWNLDTTLALIIHPALIKMRASAHGSPNVSDDDVPEELKSTSAPAKINEDDIDDNFHKRWEWALDEMIFAFDEILQDRAFELFSTGKHDIIWKPLDDNQNETSEDKAKFYEMTKGLKDTYQLDKVGFDEFNARIQNGLRLFGVYYRNLWT